MKKISGMIRKIAQKDTVIGHTISGMYLIFSKPYVCALVSSVFPFIMSNTKGGGKVVAIIVFLILLSLVFLAQNYTAQKTIEGKKFQNALKSLQSVFKTYSGKLEKVAMHIKLQKTKNAAKIRQILADSDFQTAALCVCEKLHDALDRDGLDDVSVTVFQRDSNSCKMIAYSSGIEPVNYEKSYPIPDAYTLTNEKIEHHSVIFAKNQRSPSILVNKAAVDEAFVPHEGCEEREANIQQYIGFPILSANKTVVFLLQVDTTKENLFGDSKEAVSEFSDNIVRPFALLLHMIYEEGRAIEQLLQ